jgi:hypothetical protein
MIVSMRGDDELQMNAYCDGELDPASAIEFGRRLAGDETLKARYNRCCRCAAPFARFRNMTYLRVYRPASSLRWVPIGRSRRIGRARLVVRSRRDVRVGEAGRFRRWPRQRCLAR